MFKSTGTAWQQVLSPGQALQLSVTGTNRQIKFGGPVSVTTGLDAQSGRSSTNGTVPHGMGLTPTWAMVIAAGRVAIQETSYTVVPAGAVTGLDGTNISYSWTINGTSNNGFAFYWIAVGSPPASSLGQPEGFALVGHLVPWFRAVRDRTKVLVRAAS